MKENKEKKRGLIAILLTMLLLLTMPAMSAFAEGDVVNIDSEEDLIEAILNQKDSQTWVISEGNYDIGDACVDFEANINGVKSGFVFPIIANDLTIKGNGNVTIISTYDTNTGNWAGQNFITVKGTGVTIDNIDFKGNPNSFYDGQCNKVIELIDGAKDFTLMESELLPLLDAEGKKSSGSIYVNVQDAGNTVLENVTMYSWINAKTVTAGNVEAKNVVQDFTNNTYAGYSDAQYGYAWNPGISGDKVTLNGFTIKVDENSNFIEQVIRGIRPGTTVELATDITVGEGVYLIDKPNITINGNGNSIKAGDDFKMNLEGQINLFKIQSDGVTLNDVQLITNEKAKHALDVWGAKDVVLNNVTLDHSVAQSGAPLIINGSNVTVKGDFEIKTGENSWYGINIDDKDGKKPTLEFAEGANVKYENGSDIDLPLVYVELKDNAPEDVVINPENAGLILGENGQFEEHVHDFGKDWASDETNHWHECTCGEKADLAEHIMDAGTITKEPTKTEDGIKTFKCSVCGRVLKEETIAAIAEPEKPEEPEQTQKPEEKPSDDTPKTGDGSQIYLFASMLAVAATTLVVLLANKRRDSKER